MNVVKTLRWTCLALTVLASTNALSQPAATDAASAVAGASAAPSSKQANRALRRAVYKAFAKDKSIDAGNIGVSAKNGVVTLSGAVEDAAQIDKAVALAKDVSGVVSVQNKLTVKRVFSQ